ncbi:Sec-independent protein secretion pathway components (plasmid) [Rhodococcus erythropolis R138]|nr:Sec-independent protein secretion pathway components [Rhodococcus erythropolis R138]
MARYVTGWHALIVLAILLLVFGSTKLPSLAKGVGQSMRVLKDEAREDTTTVRRESASTADTTAPARDVDPNATVPYRQRHGHGHRHVWDDADRRTSTRGTTPRDARGGIAPRRRGHRVHTHRSDPRHPAGTSRRTRPVPPGQPQLRHCHWCVRPRVSCGGICTAAPIGPVFQTVISADQVVPTQSSHRQGNKPMPACVSQCNRCPICRSVHHDWPSADCAG